MNVTDAIWMVGELARGGPAAPCRRAADANADNGYDLSDPLHLIRWRYLEGPEIPAPFPDCGAETTGWALDCPEGTVPFCDR